MAEAQFLSRWEIDSLLSPLETQMPLAESVAAGPKVKGYDFRRPNKFSREQLRALDNIFDALARQMSQALSSIVRLTVPVRLASVEQVSFEDYVRQLQPGAVFSIFNMRPLPGLAILEIELRLAFNLLERLLGGAGSEVRNGNELTEIEAALLRDVVENIGDSQKDAWAGIVALEPQVEDLTVWPSRVQAALPVGMTVLARWDVSMAGAQTSGIALCIPYPVLEPIAAKLSTRAQMSLEKPRDGDSPANSIMAARLEEARLPITVCLGSARVRVKDLRSLKVGDVVQLDTSVWESLCLKVGGRDMFWGTPGRVGNRLAVRITRVRGGKAPRLDSGPGRIPADPMSIRQP